MRILRLSLVLASMLLAAPVPAMEPLEWLPPPPVQAPFWDMKLPEQIAFPADDFSRLLTDRPSVDSPRELRPIGGRMKQSSETAFEIFKLKSNLETPDWRELRDTPALARDWKAEQSLNIPLPLQESLFMFGQFATGGDVDQTQGKMKGRTGVGLKWSLFDGAEVQVRTGPVVKYEEDPQTRTLERSRMSVEMQAKLALFGPLQLQYAGEANSPFAATDRPTLLQDLKLALPFGTNREFNFGAKYRTEETLTPTPWMQRAELYMGLRFQH